ncbi:MAG: hypothetical protein M3Z23_18975 [Acidobacteriota bacterium]|nr:hypothetical protein [Acidobacteriota bacterium]
MARLYLLMMRWMPVLFLLSHAAACPNAGFLPGARVLLDAHNCYPYDGKWGDRIDRALSIGAPLAIEQDLAWNGTHNIVTHGRPFLGDEPTLQSYFFERIRPLIEQALNGGDRGNWPLITLNLDLKSEEPELLADIWSVLGEYKDWLTTAERAADPSTVTPFDVKPVLVLTGVSDAQQKVFYDQVPVGGRLRVFGAAHLDSGPANLTTARKIERAVSLPPERLAPEPANNYRRWLNFSWYPVEKGGQRKAGDWTAASNDRLRALVRHAHSRGLWIRFYTLDGLPDPAIGGWDAQYNLGSLEKVRARWQAAIDAGVDFVATDQYEELSKVLKRVLVHGHRGARAMRPENTIPAFQYAIAAGVDALELDMAVTKDNVLVVSHDPLLNPAICQGPRPGIAIHQVTLAELREYDCGAQTNPNFPKQAPVPGTRMPTLDQVFDLAGEGKFDFNIETKSFPGQPQYTPPPDAFARLVLEAIRRHNLESRIILQSFDFRTLHAMRKLAPNIRRSALYEGTDRDFVKIAREADATIISPYYKLVTPENVHAAHQAGLQVVPWTANTPEDWKTLVSAGVDAIISDDPAALISWLRKNR